MHYIAHPVSRPRESTSRYMNRPYLNGHSKDLLRELLPDVTDEERVQQGKGWMLMDIELNGVPEKYMGGLTKDKAIIFSFANHEYALGDFVIDKLDAFNRPFRGKGYPNDIPMLYLNLAEFPLSIACYEDGKFTVKTFRNRFASYLIDECAQFIKKWSDIQNNLLQSIRDANVTIDEWDEFFAKVMFADPE